MLALLYLGPWVITAGLLAAFGVFDDDDDTAGSDPEEDTIVGTDGDDELTGSEVNDEVIAKSGDDEIWTFAGDDTVYAEEGDDTIIGGEGDDSLRGGDGADFIYDVEGADTIVAGAGEDTVYSAAMADGFTEEETDSYLADDSATFDALIGAHFTGADFARDPDSNDGDVIKLGRGDDAVVAGANDTVTGGAGADAFGIFMPDDAVEDGYVTVTDYDKDEDILVVWGDASDVTLAEGDDGGTEVRVDGALVAFLEGVDFTTLSASDIVFAGFDARP